MICLTVKIRFGNHETVRHGSRKILRIFLIWEHKQFNISKHIIEQNIKNDDSIVKITHIHIPTHTHKKLHNYFV